MLAAMEKTISIAQLAKNAEAIAKDIETSGTLYRIKRPGRKRLLLVDDQYFERWAATREFMLRHPNWKQELAQGDREYAAGLYVPLEQILEERGLAEVARKAKRKSGAGRTSGARSSRRGRDAVRAPASAVSGRQTRR
jgi:hypothetical protein